MALLSATSPSFPGESDRERSTPSPPLNTHDTILALYHDNQRLRKENLSLKKLEKTESTQNKAWFSQHLFELLTEHVSDLISIVDARGHRLWSNASYFKVLGYTQEELQNAYFLAEIHPEDQPLVAETFSRTYETGMEEQLEYRAQHKNGNWVDLEFQASVVKNEHDQPDCLVLISRDVTERKKREDKLIEDKAEQSIREFSADFVRDFQEFLSYVTNKLKLNKGLPGSDDVEIERALQRAQDMTQRLSQLAPPQLTTHAPRLSTNLEALARTTISELLQHSRARSEFIFPPGLPEIKLEAEAVQQAIRHVMINAMQATEPGFFRISMAKITPEVFKNKDLIHLPMGHYLRLSLQDNGHGMSESIRARATEPYFTTRKGAQGMGLALTKAILERHQGGLSLESVAGLGTTVSMYLPYSPLETLRASTSAPVLTPTHRPRALIMDDEAMVLDVASRMLDHLGYEVTTCRDGAQTIASFAKAKAQGHSFDLVLLDLMVPRGIGGIDAIHTIKKISPAARVIVCSGHLDHPAMLNSTQFGFAASLPKPYQLQKLQKVLEEVLHPG